MLKPLVIAFSMYSRIPMPMIDWDEKSMKYAICFLPFVGAVIGIITYILFVLFEKLGFGVLLKASMLTAVPLIVTGGIHLDGFIDTCDAISSHLDRKRRLEIMADPHVGAFAIIKTAVYMVLSVGFCSEISIDTVQIVCIGYIISRALSGIAVITFPKAKDNGLVSDWSRMSDKKISFVVLSVELVIALILMFILNFKITIIIIIVSTFTFLYHYRNCMKNFGGITGDLAGYFLQLEELFILAAAVFGGKI